MVACGGFAQGPGGRGPRAASRDSDDARQGRSNPCESDSSPREAAGLQLFTMRPLRRAAMAEGTP